MVGISTDTFDSTDFFTSQPRNIGSTDNFDSPDIDVSQPASLYLNPHLLTQPTYSYINGDLIISAYTFDRRTSSTASGASTNTCTTGNFDSPVIDVSQPASLYLNRHLLTQPAYLYLNGHFVISVYTFDSEDVFDCEWGINKYLHNRKL